MHTRPLVLAILCGAGPAAFAAFDGFAPRVDLPMTAGYSPTDSVLTDLNNDGNLDLACPAFTTASLDYIAVYLGNGDGTFGSPTYTRVGDSPIAIIAADVNLDSKMDLLTANRDTDDFSLRRGNGDGTFQSELFWGTGSGSGPQDLTSADFNDDGLPDVAVCNGGSDSVSVFFGNGTGGFTLDNTYTTHIPGVTQGSNPRGIDAADLNFDGLPEIVTANTGSGNATIFYNIEGAPGAFFWGEFGLIVPVSSTPFDVDAHDHDNDGDTDLVFAGDNTVTRRYNEYNGTGPLTFPLFPTFSQYALSSGSRLVGLCAADFDDLETDGDDDLVIADEVNDRIAILMNNGSGGVSFGGSFGAGPVTQDPSAGDLDGDGDIDVVAPQFHGAAVGVFLNTSTVVGGPTPVVRIDEPGDYGGSGGCVCGPSMTVTGVASIPSGGLFDGYVLDYRRTDVSTWITIKESSNPVGEPGNDLGIWNLSGQPEGLYVLRLTATSASGLTATDQAVVWVSQNYNTVDFHFASGYDDGSTNIAGRNICVYGFVNDDACGANTYSVDYRPTSGGPWLPVDPMFPVYGGDRLNTELAVWNTVSLGIPDGSYAVRVAAENGCGQTKSLTRTVTVDNTPPTAVITGPTNCFWLAPDGLVVVKGTAFDDNLASWTLEFTGGPYNRWVPIESGSTANVVDGLLAEWDVSGLPPCAYTLRLRVYDQARLTCGTSTWRSDALVTVNVGCRADLAEPFNILDLSDITAFVESFTGGCP